MGYSAAQLNQIYDRTAGKCHLCSKKLAWCNYGTVDRRGAWEVDHSRARANGGTNHGNNLYAACVRCNRSKQHGSTRSVRRANGMTRAPLSSAQLEQRRQQNTLTGGAVGLFVGAIFGPAGMVLGSVLGAAAGADADVDVR